MKISVVGLGKLGAPLAVLLASKGHGVIGIDFNAEVVEKLNKGIAPFPEPGLQNLLNQGSFNLQATVEYNPTIVMTDITFVIVPTPSETNGMFTNHYVLRAVEQIGGSLRKKEGYHLVVITSTVMPGSTNGEIRKALETTSGREVGENLGLCYNPEFIALGSVVKDMLQPDMVLIGESDAKAGDMLQSIYEGFCENNPPIQRMNCINAELTKLSLNTFVTTKISYANMLGVLCESLPESDVSVVTNAIGLDSRIGRKYLNAAVAFGGPCFPRDNVAFRAMANELGVNVAIADATQKINDLQVGRIANLVERYSLGKRIGILGLSYKPGTNVVEESPGVKVANELFQKGYQVFVYDPIAADEAVKVLNKGILLSPTLEECLRSSDTALIMTNWEEFSLKITPELMKKEGFCQLIIDCWRCLARDKFSDVCEVLYLGQGALQEKQEPESIQTI